MDGQANVTITGNTTIPGLPEGTHNIVVYANDTAENAGASDKVWFSIQASSLPFLIWTFGTIAIVAFVVLGISYYFVRKRKRHVS